jgi:hypothetical protein
MAIRLSAGLQSSLLTEFGLASMMNYGVIEVYSGEQPLTASYAPTGTLLGTITEDGLGFVVGSTTGGLRVAYSGVLGGLVKQGTWRLRGVTNGAPGWWRWKWNAADDDSESLFLPRMDGAVGESLVIGTNQLSPTTNIEIADFLVAFAGE